MLLKTCRGCGKQFLLEAFPTNGRDPRTLRVWYRARCTTCWRAYKNDRARDIKAGKRRTTRRPAATHCRDCGGKLTVRNKVSAGTSRYSGKPQYQNRCRKCWHKYVRNWDRTHPERAATHRKSYMLAWLFGLLFEEYQQMLERQNGRCAICGSVETKLDARTKKPRSLGVDHCHATGKIRGLLCNRCNRAMGLLGDDPDLLDRAAAYLRAHALT